MFSLCETLIIRFADKKFIDIARLPHNGNCGTWCSSFRRRTFFFHWLVDEGDGKKWNFFHFFCLKCLVCHLKIFHHQFIKRAMAVGDGCGTLTNGDNAAEVLKVSHLGIWMEWLSVGGFLRERPPTAVYYSFRVERARVRCAHHLNAIIALLRESEKKMKLILSPGNLLHPRRQKRDISIALWQQLVYYCCRAL